MPDEVKNEQKVETPEVEEKQPEDMLTSEETTGEDELPEDANERTREQFEKLKQHNKELAEQLRQKEDQSKPDSVFNTLKPEAPQQPVELPNSLANLPQNELDQLMDENGYIDPVLLKKFIAESQTQSKQALDEAKRIREEFEVSRETEQVKEAHKKFPYLNPKSTDFNPKFFDAVKNEMVSQMIRGEKDLVAAAEKVSQWFPTTAPKESQVEKKELQARQANLTGKTQSRPPAPKADEDLQRRMWKGDRNALLERLKNAGL